ncbi:hypothetical protein, partial [Peribacillus frigoritolerans]|uniref:hypothetical protein n=1 Tax=Peribacillus frigoritolerans TaxID=450367 RepID=UPI00362F2265
GFLKSTGIIKRKNCRFVLFRTLFKTSLSFMFFPVLLNGWKKYATLLPNYWLTETPQPLGEEAWRGGLAGSRRKGSGFLKSTGTFFK